MPLSLTLLAAAVPPAMRSAAIGIWGGVSGLGVALGPVIGGAVVEGVSWQAIFWLNVPVALVALPLLLLAVAESKGAWQKLDLRGTAAARRRGLPRHLGHRPRQRRRLDLGRRSSARWSPRCCWCRRTSSTPAAWRTRCCRCGCSPGAGFSVANVIGLIFTLGHVRRGVPAQPVPPDRAGLHPARGRHPHPAVDRGADGRRPDRRRWSPPDRAAPAAAHRPGPAGRVAGLARRRSPRASRRTPRSSRRSPWPASAWV